MEGRFLGSGAVRGHPASIFLRTFLSSFLQSSQKEDNVAGLAIRRRCAIKTRLKHEGQLGSAELVSQKLILAASLPPPPTRGTRGRRDDSGLGLRSFIFHPPGFVLLLVPACDGAEEFRQNELIRDESRPQMAFLKNSSTFFLSFFYWQTLGGILSFFRGWNHIQTSASAFILCLEVCLIS